MQFNLIKETKAAIREWFGTLSIREITTNKKLSLIFENIEQLLRVLEEEEAKGFTNESYTC